MKRKGIPKKRIGPESGYWERSIRKRQIKVVGETLNAAERSFCRNTRVSLCDMCPEMVKPFYGIGEEKKRIKMKRRW